LKVFEDSQETFFKKVLERGYGGRAPAASSNDIDGERYAGKI
jgi:hypothetical protein